MTRFHPEDTVAISRPRREESRACFRLTVELGPDEGDVFQVDGAAPSAVLIGTSEACSIRLRDPEVSRRHASVELSRGDLRLRDLNSTNGTTVDGIRAVEVLLRGGEQLKLGATTLRVERDVQSSPVAIPKVAAFGALLGGSLAMRRLYPICQRLAESDVPLVIEGETGTGKEALAEAIHAASPRANGPFVVFDCTAVPDSLIESALFGHEKGAFTGAVSSRPGVFEEAHKGTLLIDEIGDLDKSLQSKLLRAIQKSEVRRLGGQGWVKVDARVIAATRRDLDKEVQAGRFRDDLFFRLAVARIALPPLRERQEDIEALARHFWAMYGGKTGSFPSHLLDRFNSHPWPGNVRELANTIARLVALGDMAEHASLFLQPGAVPKDDGAGDGGDFIAQVVEQNLTLAEARDHILREFERQYVIHLLDLHGGDATRAAAASGIGERYLRMIRARIRRA